MIPVLSGNRSLWWQLATIISCGTLAGAVIPELVKVFTSTDSRHVQEVVKSAEEGGASSGTRRLKSRVSCAPRQPSTS
jgi:K(+)-stimulated pyrophosphate-energized sodium pump